VFKPAVLPVSGLARELSPLRARCGAEANYGASASRACEQPFEYPKP
jgi:hypothetical protein